MFIKNDATLFSFRIKLLNTVLLTTFVFSFIMATRSIIFPTFLDSRYMYVLYFYSFINLVAYALLRYNRHNYFLSVNLSAITSVFTFDVLMITVLHDEFRLIWFFFTVFSSFMFGGRKYGISIVILVISTVVPLFLYFDTNLSHYAIMTFVASIVIFSIFTYSFLIKIENDEKRFEERLNDEIEKRQAHENTLLRQQRMTNMGEMVDAIAHQWRQPLMQSNIILLDIYETLEDKDYDDGFRKNKIKEVVNLTAHMSQTIDDFRYLLTDNKEKISFNLDESIKEVLKLMRNRLNNVDVTLNMNPSEIFGLKNEFVQALVIIISNAIEVLNNKDIRDKKIYIDIQEDENNFIINIEDNAKGINEKIISKVFDAYFTTKKQDGGTGLGLHIAKILIEQNMYGKLTVQNTNHGARFTIKIGKKDGEKFKTI